MPPKKVPATSSPTTRATRSMRGQSIVSNASDQSSVTTPEGDSSQLNSVSSTPNTSISMMKLEDLSYDDDDFQPVKPSAVALGKRRKVESPMPVSLKRTRSSGSMQLSQRLKVEDTPDGSVDDESINLSQVKSENSSPSPSPISRRTTRISRSRAASFDAKKPVVTASSSFSAKTPKSSKPPAKLSTKTPKPPTMTPAKTSRAASQKARAAVAAQVKKDESASDSDDEEEGDSDAELSEETDDSDDDSEQDEDSSNSDSGSDPPPVQMEKVNLQLLTFHPELATVWDELADKVSVSAPELADQPEGLRLKLLPFQREGLSWMRKQENGLFQGGILADEMGMGKTIQMISLLLTEPGKPNLIVAPTVAIVQWKNEINDHAPSLKVLIFHGPNRTGSMSELTKHDVVLTTYSILESAYRKQKYGFKRQGMTVKEDSLLHRIKWHRVILDEAHNIKERSCNTARSAFELESDRKWSLSGTPMQNRVGELYSLIRFMQADPYGYYFCKKCPCKSLHWRYSNKKDCDDCGHRPMDHVCWWNNEILKPIQNHGTQGVGEKAFGKLRLLLDRIMLRRTKIERADDLGLPPRTMTVSRYLFNEEEEDLYESLFSDTQRKFSTYVEQGTVLNNYANIFELLTKMRQMVDHPDMVLKKIKPGQVGLIETMVCSICQEEAEDPIVSKCHHLFCREDAEQYVTTSLAEAPECPVCHIPLSIDLQQPTYVKDETEADAEVRHKTFARTSIINRINMDTWRSSTKIEALVEQLFNLQREDRSTKSICFSQYVTFLDLIKWRLEKAGFKCVKLDGHMTPSQRDASIQKFTNDPNVTVFLISLKAGGVALNLTAASRVFICDPWWNPAAELQAMDRIHRIGQYRPILITRLIIENSIESRILQLQEKKQAMVDSTIGKDPAALARLTPEDLRFLFVN
ncbi:DNA repair protein rad16 [Podila verticillata]|nr:DNA repair protein rad16 [Podila verticillata]